MSNGNDEDQTEESPAQPPSGLGAMHSLAVGYGQYISYLKSGGESGITGVFGKLSLQEASQRLIAAGRRMSEVSRIIKKESFDDGGGDDGSMITEEDAGNESEESAGDESEEGGGDEPEESAGDESEEDAGDEPEEDAGEESEEDAGEESEENAGNESERGAGEEPYESREQDGECKEDECSSDNGREDREPEPVAAGSDLISLEDKLGAVFGIFCGALSVQDVCQTYEVSETHVRRWLETACQGMENALRDEEG